MGWALELSGVSSALSQAHASMPAALALYNKTLQAAGAAGQTLADILRHGGSEAACMH